MVEYHADGDINVSVPPSLPISTSVQTTNVRQITQNFITIWLNTDKDKSNDDYKDMNNKLRNFVHKVEIFMDMDKCIDFLTDMENGIALMIITGTLGEEMVPLIHDISQINAMLIFSDNQFIDKQSVKKWSKVRIIHTEITSISEVLNRTIKDCDRHSMPISFISSNEDFSTKNLDQLEPSFMYTQVLKEILLEMEYNEQSIKDFVSYCVDNNYATEDRANKFEREYYSHVPIWWYTSESFLYTMLNRALRILETDGLIKMGFFLRDLHRHISKLHSEQFTTYDVSSFTVYRGQGLTKSDFDKLVETKNGLICFNHFLSTSKNRDISILFADSNRFNLDLIGILFEIKIDSSISLTPFACISHLSQFDVEEEILFSMHTVFRIEEISQLENHDQLYHVKLKLTSDNDQQLSILTERLQMEVEGSTGWGRLGQLLFKLGQYDKAQDLYQVLLDQTTDESRKIHFYHQLGLIKANQGNYLEGLALCERAIQMKETMLPPNHPDLSNSYNNIAMIYNRMDEYSKALSFYEKALAINLKNFPSNDLHVGTLYNNIGFVYQRLGNYPQTLWYLNKSLEILQENLPANHSDIVATYSNIGETYTYMNEYLKARSYFKNALDIGEKIYPPNHPYLGTLHNNMGASYYYTQEHLKAISCLKKTCEIFKKVLSPKHPQLAATLNNIGSAYHDMREYSEALLYYKKAVDICQNLPLNRSNLATYYSNMADVYFDMKDFSKALSLFEKSIEINQNILPPTHLCFPACYCKIASIYRGMGDFSKALLFYEKELEILIRILPTDFLSIAKSYNNISAMQTGLKEYSKALLAAKKSLETVEKLPVPNYLLVVTYHNDIGLVCYFLGDNTKALTYLEKAIEIGQKTISPNHPTLSTTHVLIGNIYKKIGEYSKSLSFYQRALVILKQSLPPNHHKVKFVEDAIQSVTDKQ